VHIEHDGIKHNSRIPMTYEKEHGWKNYILYSNWSLCGLGSLCEEQFFWYDVFRRSNTNLAPPPPIIINCRPQTNNILSMNQVHMNVNAS